MVEEFKRRGWPPLTFLPVDEMGNTRERFRRAGVTLRLIHGVGGRTGATLNNLWHMDEDDAEDPTINPYLDVRIYSFIDQWVIENTKRAGDEFWIYYPYTAWSPKLSRYWKGLFNWVTGAKGSGLWVYWWQPYIDRFPVPPNQVTSPNSFAFPSPDGPLPTIGFQGVREGIGDRRYIYTLTNLIEKSRKLNREEINTQIKAAQKVLSDLAGNVEIGKRGVNSNPAVTGITDDIAADSFDIWRGQVARKIMKLRELLR